MAPIGTKNPQEVRCKRHEARHLDDHTNDRIEGLKKVGIFP